MWKFVNLDRLRASYQLHRPLWLFSLALIGSLALSWAVNVYFWRFVLGDRPPQQMELVIPLGTARRVAAGEAVPSIPAHWSFIVGDVLILRNEDETAHQLGPFWVPAGTTARIPFESPSTVSFVCTIHPSRYIGVEVKPRTDPFTKLMALLGFALPLAAVMGLLALAYFPGPEPTERSGSHEAVWRGSG
jgi:hypothetical protein